MSMMKNQGVSIEDDPKTEADNNRAKKFLAKYVPITQWLPRYTKFAAISDLIAGITLGLTMIPQSMAYAGLAGLTPQYGLYSSFLGNFVYILFGTIKEVSIGATSLMALLTIEYTREMPPDFVILLTFLAGCVELFMGLFDLGFLVDFISMPVTSGFTSATAVVIIITQLQGLLGLKVKYSGTFDCLIKVIKHITETRLADFALGICSIIFLLCFRQLKDLKCCESSDKKKKKKKSRLGRIPWFLSTGRNAIIVLITSIISFHVVARGSSPFVLSGKVPPGLPPIALPPFASKVGNETYTFVDMCSHLRSGIILVPLISVLANVAIAKAFASGTAVNASQEMLTLGLCNIFGSFFSSMPTCGAFTRSAVSSASGIQTPMAGLYAGFMTLLALSFLTPYFYYIPRSVLSAVLISAVIFIIDWQTIVLLWRGCRRDAVLAILTFAVSLVCGVEVGLLFGVVFNLIFLIRQSVRPDITVTECKTELDNKFVKIIPESDLTYAAVENFCSKVLEVAEKYSTSQTPIVVDYRRVKTCDYTTVKGIERLFKILNAEKTRLWITRVNSDIAETVEVLIPDRKYFCLVQDERNFDQEFFKISEHNSLLPQKCQDIDLKEIK